MNNYKGYTLHKDLVNVSDKDIENEIENLKQRLMSYEKVDRDTIKKDDALIATTTDKSGTRDIKFDLSDEWTGKLFGKLIGAKVGETKEIKIVYPQDFPVEEIRGKEKEYKLEIKEIQEKRIPQTPEEIISKMGDRFKTFDDLKKEIRKELEEHFKTESEHHIEEQIAKNLVKDNPTDVPPSLIELTLARFISSKYPDGKISKEDYDKLAEDLRPTARDVIAKEMLLESIAEAEKLEITDPELDQFLKEEAEKLGTSLNILKSYLIEKGQLESRRGELLQQKAIDFIKENSEIIEKPKEEKKEPSPEKSEDK